MSLPDRQAFLIEWTPEEVINRIKSDGKVPPQVGVFVPDGNRRLVLATTNVAEGSVEFFKTLARVQTDLFLQNLDVFFAHKLPVLFVPLFSHSVLERGEPYRNLTALETLKILFTDDRWLDFYNARDVRVRIYGNPSILSNYPDCEQCLAWIEHIQQATREHISHLLFLGIGGESQLGWDAAQATAQFYREHQREPSRAELAELLYGQAICPAAFFIISSKFAGLGALPALVCGGDTQVYYLPVPGVKSLTAQTYRAILYDLVYMRDETGHLGADERKQLKGWYADHAEAVIGLGHKIGPAWVPEMG